MSMARPRRRKVFVSYHHQEHQEYKDRFVRMMNGHIVDKSVDIGDIINPRPTRRRDQTPNSRLVHC